MKLVLSLLLIAAASLTSCTTLANRRDLYSPEEQDGPWTRKFYGEPEPAAKAAQKNLPPGYSK